MWYLKNVELENFLAYLRFFFLGQTPIYKHVTLKLCNRDVQSTSMQRHSNVHVLILLLLFLLESTFIHILLAHINSTRQLL